MNRIQQLKHKIQKLSTMDICDLLLTIGLTLLVLGRFLDPNSITAFVIRVGGSIIFLSGIAMFVAIARRMLDY
jgi:hypothetical protein